MTLAASVVVATLTTLACPVSAQDWAAPITAAQKSLADAGISIGGGVTGFGQGMAFGDGLYGVTFGGKADLLFGLDGGLLGLWNGLSVSAHLEQQFGQSETERADGPIIPLNTALALPLLGGTTTDLSLTVTQKFGSDVSVSLGKFNMLDAAAKTPIMGGGGETTFWNTAFAAPISGVAPPYIIGGVFALKTEPATFSLLIYDPRNAQDLRVIERPFAAGVTFSLSATVPLAIGGLPGFHTLRAAYSTQQGFDLEDVPLLLLPPGSASELRSKQGYYFASYMINQFCWRDPDNPARGWGLFTQVALSDANPNPIAGSGFLGLGGSTPFGSRLDDRWGVGWFKYVFSPALKVSATVAGAGLNDESGLEAYYDAKIADHIRFGPDAQLIWPGTPGKSTALFLGVRGRIVF
jgi:porin